MTSSKSLKSWNNIGAILLIIILSTLTSATYSQTPGLIFQPATGSGKLVLDPNGDGYTSATRAGFVSNDQTESEIPFIPLSFPGLEPSSDLGSGPGCGFTDFVDSGSEDPAMSRFDGTNLMFRLRLGNALNNSKGYSILIDTDQKFGFTGSQADPNATIANPGFEIEICLRTNFGVYVYNVDGGCPGAPSDSFPGTTNYQKSIALTTNCSNPDYFYDFFVPFSSLAALGITTSTPLRMAIVTQMNPQPALCNSAVSDFGGINDAACGAIPGICFNTIITNFTPTPATSLNTTIPDRSVCPTINSLTYGATSVSGTSSEIAGTTIYVYKNRVQIGTASVSGGNWTLSGISPSLATGDTITAAAIAPGKSISTSDCSMKITPSSSCSPIIDQSLTTECTPKKGFTGSAGSATAGATIKIYDALGNIVTPNAGSIYNSGTITVNSDGSWVWKCNGNSSCAAGANNCISSGTYKITQTISGMCESPAIFQCIGTSTASTTPAITGSLTTSTTSITGTSGNSASIFVYRRSNTTYTLLGSTTANGSGAWTLNGVTLNGCDTVCALAVQATLCMSAYSADKVVTSGTTIAPVITGSYCSASNITSVSGYSIEPAGTIIQVYKNGVAEGTPVAVQSNGTWTATSGINIASGSTVTAKATASCKLQSAASNSVVTGTLTTDASLSITTSPVTEGMVSVSGNATTGNTITLYIDGVQVGNTAVASGGTWTVSGIGANDLYPTGVLSVSSTAPGKCLSARVSGPTVQCLPPSTNLSIANLADSICIGSQTSVMIYSSQNNVVYQLFYNGISTGSSVLGTGSNLTVPTGNLTNSGYLKIKAIKIGTSGCTGFFTDSLGVSTILPANPVISMSGPVSICEGDTVFLSNSYPSGVQWSTGATTSQIMVLTSGTYSVTYTDQFGCSASSSSAVTFNSHPPQLTINAPLSPGYCLGDTVVLTTNYIPGLVYQWRRYGNNLPLGDTTFYAVTTPGKYRVRATNSYGCTSISEYVQITAGPSPPNIFATGPTVICIGDSVRIETDPLPGISYHWRKFGNVIPASSGYRYSATTAGKYSCVATDQYGCTRASEPVEVSLTPGEPVVIAAGPVSYCFGDSVLLSVIPEPGLTYSWKKYGNIVPGATGLTYFAKNEGQYRCVGTDANGCARASNIINVTNNPGPVEISAFGPTTFCPGGNVNLHVTAMPGNSYQWKKYNNDIIGATGLILNVDKTGKYKCVATDGNGCSRTSNTIDINAACRETINNSDEPVAVTIFPNPSAGVFTISFENFSLEKEFSIRIADVSGKIIRQMDKLPGSEQLTIEGLAKGIYTLTIAADSFTNTVKLVRL